jgi:hypothetical protein
LIIKNQGGFEPVVFLLADNGFSSYSTTSETKRELVEKNPDLVQRFVDASIKGWYSYLADPTPANKLISNTTLGLNSVDHNLSNVFQLYKANRWQTLLYLRLPSALPYFLGGLRISGGLALIGAVVAEFVAGTGGARSGLAYQILMASYNLQIPRMFAALFLTTALGVVIFVLLTFLSDFLLSNWHESAVKREN